MGLFSFMQSPMSMDGGDNYRDPTNDDYWSTAERRRSEIRVDVSVDRARQVPVVKDCLNVLAGNIAGLEAGVFRDMKDGNVERALGHSVTKLMRNPNPRHTGVAFFWQLVEDLCAQGNFVAEKIYNRDGYTVDALWRLEPESTTIEELPDRSKRVKFHDRWGRERVLVEGEFWHIALPPFKDDLVGRSPIMDDGKEAIAVAIALQRYCNILFTNDATPTTALAMDGNFADEESKQNFLRAWTRRITGKNRHRPALLEYGIKPTRMGLTSEEAQFLETRRELWIDICRLWNVPPHKAKCLEKSTFNNIEHQSLEFVTGTLRPILELIEASIAKEFLEDEERFEFNVESLLRGDIESRFKSYAIGRQWGWLSVNDILRSEKRNGIGPAGDRYMEPLNMVPVGASSEDRKPEKQASVSSAISFLHETTGRTFGGKPRLELVKDAA